MKSSFLYSLVLLLIFITVGSAQYFSRYERPISTPLVIFPISDSLIYLNEDSLITAKIGIVDTTVLPPKSTTIATFSSMIIPGAGQIYNESYWKAPVVWGLGYYFYSIYKNQDNLYNESRSLYESAVFSRDTSTNAAQKLSFTGLASDLQGQRDYYKRQRNEFGWYLVLTYALNILDAYVDAALYNFEVSPNLQGTNEWRAKVKVPIR